MPDPSVLIACGALGLWLGLCDLSYMTGREAKSKGFTHHGSYYGIPCWIGGLTAQYDDGLMVAAKWAPMEHLMTVFHYLEANLRPLKFPNDPPCFQFKVGEPIR